MAQSLEVNIKTTSDVPQAMDKAKTATVSFGRQVEDIQKKFSTAFKDVFLSFLGPMALLGVALNFISRKIEENQKKSQEANQAAIDGTNELISAEERYYQTKRANEKKAVEDAEQAKLSREQTTFEFMQNDPRGRKIYQDYVAGRIGDTSRNDVGDRNRKFNAKYDAEVQAAVAALLAEDAKKNPIKIKGADGKVENFKGPEGFGNVIGVGPNPVMEAMNAQLEEQQKQTALLEKIANKDGAVPQDFTKTPQK
jgi:hypothetical protein